MIRIDIFSNNELTPIKGKEIKPKSFFNLKYLFIELQIVGYLKLGKISFLSISEHF